MRKLSCNKFSSTRRVWCKIFLSVVLFCFFQSCISIKRSVYLQDKTQKKAYQYEQNKSIKSTSFDYKIDTEDILFVEILYQSIGNEALLDKSTIPAGESRASFSQHPYTSGYQVSDSGKILIESLGEFEVVGKTIEEIRSMIVTTANDYYLNPTVKVHLMNAFITVLGEVNTPGRFRFFDNMNALEAIGMAGDMGEFANRESIKILRPSPSDDGYQIYHIDLTNELVISSGKFHLLPGDVVLVKAQKKKKFAGRNIQWVISGLSVIASIIAILSR